MRRWLNPMIVVGSTLRNVVVGWHVFGAERAPVRLWLRFDDQWSEVCTRGDGSLGLDRSEAPASFDMAELGRFEMRPAEPSHLLRPLIGQPITRVARVVWERTCVGLVLHAPTGSVLLANEADEVFISNGMLPPDVWDAEIEG